MSQGLSPMSASDVLPQKRQVIDRLRRRMESYRRRQIDCQPRFDQTFGGLCEQNYQDTIALKQRLETKTKRQNKTKQDKQNKTTLVQQQQAAAAAAANVHQSGNDGTTSTALQSSVHVQQKFLKRGNEEMDVMGSNDSSGMEPPVKLQCTNQQHTTSTHQTGTEGLTKFSVEIVQQLEFTTSAANSQTQQILTNVTVKASTNTSVKSDISSPKSNPATPVNPQQTNTNLRTPNSNSNMGCDIGNLVECKQEPDNDFADLDQCAAALEKDAQANGGGGFPGFSDLIGDDTSDEIITSDAFKDLISEISDLNPEFMKDFDFEEKYDVNNISNINSCLKMEDSKDLNLVNSQSGNILDVVKNTQSPMLQQNPYSPPVYDAQGGQMNKNRLGYSNMDFVKTELSPAAQTLKQMAEQHQHKSQMNLSAFNSGGNVVGSRVPNARSPYGSGQDFQFSNNEFANSPNQGLHNKGFMPSADLIKQELNIFNNPTKGGNLPQSGPGMYKQQYSPYGSPSANHGSPGYMPGRGGGPGPGGPQGPGGPPPRPPSGANNNGGNAQNQATLQINQAQQLHISQQSGHGGIQVSAGQHLHLSGDLKGSVSIAAQQGMYFSQQNTSQQQSQQQQNVPVSSTNNTSQSQPNMHTSQQNRHQQQQKNPNAMPGGPNQGPNVGGPSQQHINAHQTQHMQQQGDTYTVSQSQTINFTQQSLRQRQAAAQAAAAAAAAAAANKGPNMSTMGAYPPHQRPVPGQMGDPGMMHGGQQMMHGSGMHSTGMGGIRPPPPDYKSSAALMQGNSPSYLPQNANPNIMRRLAQQPIPPSGPMMRPQQMMQPQYQNMMGNGQLRPNVAQCNNLPNHMRMGGSSDGNPEWRNMMSQQSGNNYPMRCMMGGNPSMPQMMNQIQQGGMGNMPTLQMSQGNISGPAQMLTYNQQGMGGMHMNQMGGNPGMINPGMMGHHQNMGRSNHMPMTNINMSQQQSFSMTNISNIPQNTSQLNPQQNSTNQSNMSSNNQSNQLSTFPHSAPDFNLDFLENLPAGDTNNFSAQELLNSLDSDPSFNIQDIL